MQTMTSPTTAGIQRPQFNQASTQLNLDRSTEAQPRTQRLTVPSEGVLDVKHSEVILLRVCFYF